MLIKFLTKLIHLYLYIESSVRIIFLILNLPIQEDNVSTFNFLNVLQWGFAVFPYSLHLFIFVPTVNAIYLSVIDIFCLLLVGRKATDYFLIWILHSAISATLIISNNLLILLHFQWRKSPLAKKKKCYISLLVIILFLFPAFPHMPGFSEQRWWLWFSEQRWWLWASCLFPDFRKAKNS